MKKSLILIAASLLIVILSGCTTTQTSLTDETKGNLVLSIVDAPGDYEDVHINIQKIFVKPSGGDQEWLLLGDFSSSPYGINLLDYRIQELLLPSTDVPAGSYEEIRIVLDTSGYLQFVDDPTQYPLTVGELKELDEDDMNKNDQKNQLLGDDEQAIDVEYPFWITESAITEIQIDFNVAEMIEENLDTPEQDYILNVDEVKAMDKAEASEIEGKIAIQDATSGQILPVPTQVTVSLYDVNDLVNPLTTTWPIEKELDDEDEDDGKAEPGKFKLRGIPAGEYVVTLEAEGYNTVTIEGIVFTDGEEIELGEDAKDEDHDDEEEGTSANAETTSYTITGGTIVDEYIIMTPIQ